MCRENYEVDEQTSFEISTSKGARVVVEIDSCQDLFRRSMQMEDNDPAEYTAVIKREHLVWFSDGADELEATPELEEIRADFCARLLDAYTRLTR